MQKRWNNMPAVSELIVDHDLPGRFYHHGGLMSPYTTVFDDLHDIAQVAAVVVANREKLANRVNEMPVEQCRALRNQLANEIKNLLLDMEGAVHTLGDLKNELEGFGQEAVGRIEIKLQSN